ncbi:MAG: hypothetical protein LBM68_03790 [Bacteroidales bacterium]|jgi:hypothetical protein|nr:hypothetical protein [Bacteroidales bacterium]
MSKYQENQRERAINLIENSKLFDDCKAGGKFMGKERDFVLSNSNFNLFESIRKDVVTYFEKNKISWWGGTKPTSHTLSSQIACLNYLFPIRNDKNEVLKIAKIICEDIVDVLEIKSDKFLPAYIAFEAVSGKDYLNECKEEQKPARGSQCTSIDALIFAKHKNGKNYLLPIEWKYTEHYNNTDKSLEDRRNEPKGTNGKGQERLSRYSDLINKSEQLKKYDNYKSSVYFFEPFYQLMRQTLWAEQMILKKECEIIKADDFIHAHIIPKENQTLLKKESRDRYKCSGKDMKTTWVEHLKDKNKYKIISPEDLLSNLDEAKYKELKNYLALRYWHS